MKFVVLSDIHGRADLAERAASSHPDRDGVLFLGDGIRDLSDTLTRGLFGGVRGNCDESSFTGGSYELSEELFLNLGEYNVIMMHGHTKDVKSGLDRAILYASLRGADVLLYGHTHEPLEKYFPAGYEIGGKKLQKPLWVFNPGSLGASWSGSHSYGLLQIKKGQLLLSHGEI